MREVMLILSLLLFCACGFVKPKVQYIEKPVYIKCKIPEVPKANLKTIPENGTYPEKLQVILNNYFELEKENKMLREAIKVCQ
ncbi:hypothetical protein DRN73_10110 [Candidatus Pacearchaeota archaeon]|nr:MAG: hypothetical protein DRN73_10110 [Candidatus Pacearchaeota archaeon]